VRCCTTSATRSGPTTMPTSAAAIVEAVRVRENHWMVEKHAIFQGYYFFHYIGGEPEPA